MTHVGHEEFMKNKRKELDALERFDIVNKPAHYAQYIIEPVTFIMRNDLPYYKGNCIKYICRAGDKKYEGLSLLESEKLDIQKMIRYGQMRINQIDGKDVL
jgi:hypothetical protein|tara:strand:+ start:67 stop:369 length:303 start_codon:yes stop_codon:yes gene_type:complete